MIVGCDRIDLKGPTDPDDAIGYGIAGAVDLHERRQPAPPVGFGEEQVAQVAIPIAR